MKSKEKISQISISSDSSLLKALRLMDILDRKLLLVFNDEVFVGLISIGDIQRAIIKNTSLNVPISDILRRNIRVASIHDSVDDVKKVMLEYRIECMPVIDDNGNLINVLFWEEEFAEDQLIPDGGLEGVPVVIMAGGFGSRLKPITNIIPKPLVPIGEKPIIEIIVDRFNRLGVTDFHFSVNYKHEMIRYYFDQLSDKNYSINYFMEDHPLGTAGSIFLLKKILKSTFFVSNCDILIEQDYRDIYKYHKENNNSITLVGSLKHYSIPYGTLETGDNGELLSMKEKPEFVYLINSGMYILEPHTLDLIPDNTFMHITELIDKLKEKGHRVGVFPVSDKSWFDIGEWDQYQQTLKAFANKKKYD